MTSHPIRRVVIEEYDAGWPTLFERERALIMATCGEGAFAGFEHVGSTAVPGLAAKPVIDIMPGLRWIDEADALIAPLASIGYVHTPEDNDDIPEWRYFRKFVNGVRTFHMHMVVVGSEFWVRHLLFRDYLRAFPAIADEYAALKRRLAEEYNAAATAESSVNDGYTDYKTEFVTAVERRAREWDAGGRAS